MQSAPPVDGLVNDRDIDNTNDGEHCGSASAGIGSAHVASQHQIAYVEKPENQGCRQAGIPGPPGSPNGFTPDGACYQRQRDKESSRLCGSTRSPIPTFIFLHEVTSTGN